MKLFVFFLATGLLIWAAIVIKTLRRRKRREKLLSTPFPQEWHAILTDNLPPYGRLSSSLRQQLHDLVRIFIDEKSFEGLGGLTLTDEIKVTIAAQACMLLLNRKTQCYPKLYSILVYPSTYVAGTKKTWTGRPEEVSVRLGESWHSGAVVLAWDSVKKGAANFRDGHNVTMHEFAHQLDQDDGTSDGAPALASRSAYSTWARVFSAEYQQLREKTSQGKKTVMDQYGASNPAEFFAVATETFFEKPNQLIKKHPQLYEELRAYYSVNPLEWK